MKFVLLEGKLINLSHVVDFKFVEETYNESAKCVIYYVDGRTESVSMSVNAFEALASRLDNYNLLI